ncbi:MAG: uracil-DNA glycosylase [Candidatus Riflebacteria bacterium]|nr:uracil-DNA glycosylase [Candidatus Riflebacteria bacterium]
MAAKRKKNDDATIDAIDLITLLTPPGAAGCYECEISRAAPGEEFDLIKIAAELPDIPEPIQRKPETIRPKEPSGAGNRQSLPSQSQPDLGNKNIQKSDKDLESLLSGMRKPSRPNRIEPLPDIAEDSLERIASEIAQCQKCALHKTRNKTVPGAGPQNSRLVFIGEAPGADEDASGIPFVGRAGQHLDKIITAAGFKREELFICNILKCRPPENRDPALSEMICCTPYLQRQLRLLKPSLIACLGNVAVKFVIGPDTPGITRIHGEWFNSIFEIPTMAMYHPSFLLRDAKRDKGSPNWQMWQDIQTLKKRYDALLQ